MGFIGGNGEKKVFAVFVVETHITHLDGFDTTMAKFFGKRAKGAIETAENRFIDSAFAEGFVNDDLATMFENVYIPNHWLDPE